MCNVAALSVSLGGHAAGPCRQGESEASKKGVACHACCRRLSACSYESSTNTVKQKINFRLKLDAQTVFVFTVLSVSPAHQWQCVTQNNTARTLCARPRDVRRMVRRHEWTVGHSYTATHSSTPHGSLHSHKCTHTHVRLTRQRATDRCSRNTVSNKHTSSSRTPSLTEE
jgi:hypothetical protein